MVKFNKTLQKKEGSKVAKNLMFMGILIGLTILVNIIIIFLNSREVEIVMLEKPVQQEGLITQKNFKKGTMSRKNYMEQGVIEVYEGFSRRAVILWEDREQIKTAYAAHYIRAGVPVYWDSLTTEPPQDYAYLYEMEGELLKLEVDASHFGSMLIPGDKLNIRISYTENSYNLPSDNEYKQMVETGAVGANTVTVNEKLFSEVTVLDILNSEGESIFDMYYELLNYSAQQQKQFVESEEFKEKTTPAELLITVTPEEADNYLAKQSKGAQMLITLLPRTSKSTISEVLKGLGIE